MWPRLRGNTETGTVLVVTHRQEFTAAFVNIRGYPVQLSGSKGAKIACDEATARAIHAALTALLGPDPAVRAFGDGVRPTEPVPVPPLRPADWRRTPDAHDLGPDGQESEPS